MAYDETLADRVRELLSGEPQLSEQKMFGGLAFLIGGNMAVAVSGQGGLLVRVEPATSAKLMATTSAGLMVMRGRSMQGWLRVEPEQLRTQHQLEGWIRRSTSFVRSLPVKKK